MKKTLLILAFAVCAQSHGGNIVISSSGGKRFATTAGGNLPAGAAVRIGTFNLPPATRDQTLRTTFDYSQLMAWFKPLAEGEIGGGTASQTAGAGTVLRSNGFPAAGDIFGSITGISSSYLPPGAQLYVWVFDNAAPDACEQWGIFTSPGWIAPQELGTQTLSTTAAVEALHGAATSSQLLLNGVPLNYPNWSWKAFTLAAPPATTDRGADPDHDGIANLAEYAWKLNPAASDTARTAIEASASGGATFTFKSPRNLPDVAVTAECSTDLLNWQPAPSTVIASDADFDTRMCSAEPGSRCFWRVRIATAP